MLSIPVVQELCPTLPAALSTEVTTRSSPAVVLRAKPGASALVLSCCQLPSKHQRTHGLKTCPRDSVERLDCTGKMSCPEHMDIVLEDPAEAGRLVMDDKTQNRMLMELNLLPECLSKDATMAKDTGDVAKEDLMQCPLTVKETCWSKEEPQLIQEGREFSSSYSCIETAGGLQQLEENQEKVQVTSVNLSNPVEEAQGMTPDGTRPFSKAGEHSAKVNACVPPESSECLDVDTVMAEVAVSGTGTLLSLEHFHFMESRSRREQLKEDEGGRCLTTCATLSATGGSLPSCQAGRRWPLIQDEEVHKPFNNCPPALLDKMSLYENDSSALVLESKIIIDTQLSSTNSQIPGHLLGSSLEFGNAQQVQNAASSEVQKEGCSDILKEGLNCCTSEKLEGLVEEWASRPHTWSRDSEHEQGRGDCVGHSHEEAGGIQKKAAVQYCRKDIDKKPHSENGKCAVPVEQFAGAKGLHPAKGLFSLLPSPEERLQDGCRQDCAGTASIPKDQPQLCASSSEGRLATKEHGALLMGAEGFGCFRSSCHVSRNSHPTCHGPQDGGAESAEESSVQMGPSRDPKPEVPKNSSAITAPPAPNSSSTVDVSLGADEENPQRTQLCKELRFTKKANRTSGSSVLLSGLTQGLFPETWAKLGVESTSCLPRDEKELACPGRASCECAVTTGETQHRTALMLRDTEEGTAPMNSLQSTACSPGGGFLSETCCSMLGSVSLDHGELKLRTKTTTEESDQLEMSRTAVFDRGVIPAQVCSDGQAWGCHPSGSDWGGLDGAESMSSTGLRKNLTSKPDAEAESQRTDSDDISATSEAILGVNASVFPPCAKLRQDFINASLVVESFGKEAIEGVKTGGDSQRKGLREKLVCGRHWNKIPLSLELGKLTKDQSKEGGGSQQAVPGHPSSSVPDLSSQKSDLASGSPAYAKPQACALPLERSCSKEPDQARHTVQPAGQQNDFNHGNEAQAVDILEHRPPLMLPEKQTIDCIVQTATRSRAESQKLLCCRHSRTPCPEKGQGVENGMQETLLQRAGRCGTFREMVLIGHPLEESFLGCLECAPELLMSNGFVTDQAHQVAKSESSAAVGAVSRSPSDVLDKRPFLKFNTEPSSAPNQVLFQPDSLAFIAWNSQTGMEGVYSKSFKKNATPHLTHVCLAVHRAEHLRIFLSQNCELSSKALCLPLTKRPPAASTSLRGEPACPHSPLAAEPGRASPSFGADTCAAYPLDGRGIPISAGGSARGAGRWHEIVAIIFSSSNPSRKMKPSVEDDQTGHPRTAEAAELPVPFLSHPKNSGALLQCLRLPIMGEEAAFPFRVEVLTRSSFAHPSEHIPELGLSKAKDPSKVAVIAWYLENSPCTSQTQCLFPTRLSLEILWRTVACASSCGSVLEDSPTCLPRRGGCLLGVECGQDLAGVKRKVLESQLVHLGTESPAKKRRASATGDRVGPAQRWAQGEAEAVAALHATVRQRDLKNERARSLLKRRGRVARPPLGSSSHEMDAGLAGLTQQTLAAGSPAEDCEGICGTFWGAKRPKSAMDLIVGEDAGTGCRALSFRSHSCQPAQSDRPTAVHRTWPRAIGSRHGRSQAGFVRERSVRRPLPFSRQPQKACARLPPAGRCEAAKTGLQMPSSAFLKAASRRKCTPPTSVYFATKPAAMKSTGAIIWNRTPKCSSSQSSLLDFFRLRCHAKAHAVLFRRRPASADAPTASPRTPQKLKLLLRSTQLVPATAEHTQPRSKKLLEMVSCIKVKLCSPWISGGSCCFKVFHSQSVALCPIEVNELCCLEPSHRTPLAFSAPVAPASWHAVMEPSSLRNPAGIRSLHSTPQGLPLQEELGAQPSRWDFSFLLPERCPGIAPVQKDAWAPAESDAVIAGSLTAAKKRERDAVAQGAACPMRGLQTVLALVSPGCYRAWTRERNLSRRVPAVQKLVLPQLAWGWKGLRGSPSVSADLFSSLLYSLDRGLSLWSQRGPSTCPSEFSPLCAGRHKWQPVTAAATRLGLGNSSAMAPLLPDRFIEAAGPADDLRLTPPLATSLPSFCSALESAQSPAGPSAPDFQAHPLDELDVSVPALSRTRIEEAESEKRPKKVSQIRIRKAIPKPDPNLTPMGLPRPKRLKKTEFSLEEIYTNKNYSSPPTTRCLETIFEEPKEKNGSLISISQQKRKRILEFQDFTVPRKRKARSRVKVMGSFTRAQKAALEGRELDVLLIQKLTDLEMFFAKEEQEQASGS
ncbi:protein PRR14L isoform X2 [Varanus komodoensis]|uniref:protein PRR14L isoform X2 n=1 Tax=Varanus komodoensis TaxID=61221 RepID=UPI001CF7DEA5|nr:protein PRR14L isoform X2 [Varanus komodoensis]